MTKSPKKIDASIIILNYNAGQYLSDCLQSFYDSDLKDKIIELIVVDNASTDNSFNKIKTEFSSTDKIKLVLLPLEKNLGFSAGNNQGVKVSSAESRYVIFINPDTTIKPDTISGMIDYLDQDQQISAATCFVRLALTDKLQPESHRGFPTPLNTFWHFFGFGLPRIFPKSQFFNGYFMGHLDYTKPQIIDCCVGAFLMVRREVGQKIGWWNEDYFMYGEDLDFCFQLRKNNYHLYFVPFWEITHYQGISSGIKKTKSSASRETKIRSALATTNAMKTFYQKNLLNNYSLPLQWIVMLGINILVIIRLFKAKYL